VSGARAVYVTHEALTLPPPGHLVYHREGQSGPLEELWTACGLTIFNEDGEDEMVAIRRDMAELLGRACCRCFHDAA
jgi:hypothetical protein